MGRPVGGGGIRPVGEGLSLGRTGKIVRAEALHKVPGHGEGLSSPAPGGPEERFALAPTDIVELNLRPRRGRSHSAVFESPGRAFGHQFVTGQGPALAKVDNARSAARLRARHPVRTLARSQTTGTLRKRDPAPVRRDRPLPRVVVIDAVHQAIRTAEKVDSLPSVRKEALIRPEHHPGLRQGRVGRVLGDNEITARRNDGPSRKGVFHSIVESPTRKIDVDTHLVVELDPLPVLGASLRIVVELIEHDHAVGSDLHHHERNECQSCRDRRQGAAH